MRKDYLNKIVDIIDPDCEFINEFNYEIKKYGALVYNHENNTYQFIKNFEQIELKKELLPDFMKVQTTDLLNKEAMLLTVHYEFDPETETDEENLDVWEKELSIQDVAVYKYDDDGEAIIDDYIPLYPNETKHTIWFLDQRSYDYICSTDLLMLLPIIKNLSIIRKLALEYVVNPFEYKYDKNDLDAYIEPDFFGTFVPTSTENDFDIELEGIEKNGD